MILTVNLNPAVDRTCKLEKIEIGKVNRLKEVKAVAGGKGINVTKVLCKYKMPVIAMGFLGGNNGSMIQSSVEEMGADAVFTRTSSNTRMNSNIITEDGRVTEILEPGAPISESEVQTFLSQYEAMLGEAEIVILSGSLPAGLPDDFYGKLIDMAHEYGSFVILDSSKEALRKALEKKPNLVKPNVAELEALFEKKLPDLDARIAAANVLVDRGIENVALSMGAEGILFVSKDKLLHIKAPKVTVANTVGCGDSAVAALAMGFFEKLELTENLKRAVAIATANAMTMENGDIPTKEIRGLLEKTRIVNLK